MRLCIPTEEVCFSFTAALAGISEIELFDALGSKIAATVIREISNGKSRAIIIGRNLTPGIYFYKVTVSKSVKSGKLIKW